MIELKVRPLLFCDRKQVSNLDNQSGNDIFQWISDNEDYAWGLFIESKLIGYCSVGDCDDVGKEISSHPDYDENALYLSDVFILPEYRNQKYGVFMISNVLRKRNPDHYPVYLSLMYDGLSKFYSHIGFVNITNKYMVKNK